MSIFFRENPAQTHRLIPWLNRELVVLIPRNSDAIPQILEEMRELLCVHNIQSREMHDYFQPHLLHRTEHFVHEFHSKFKPHSTFDNVSLSIIQNHFRFRYFTL